MEETERFEERSYGIVKEDESGWKLYYSEEGYPYYYNEATGDSRWAEYDNSSYLQNHDEFYTSYQDSSNYQSEKSAYDPRFHSDLRHNALHDDREISRLYRRRDEEQTAPGEEEDESGDENEEDSDEDESSESSEEKEEMDRKFKEYLRTPEGIAAVLYEQERIELMIQKKQEKQSAERDAEYVQSLLITKKSDGDVQNNNKARIIKQPMNVFESVREGFNFYLKGLIDPAERAEKAEKKLKKKIDEMDEKNRTGKSLPSDETTVKSRKSRDNRRNSANSTIPVDIEDPRDHENDGTGNLSKSSSSSDLVSLSSEDSDVAVINAPVFSEISPFLGRFYSTYVEPTRQYLDESGISSNTLAAANLMLVGGRYLVYNVATATYSIATGIFSLGGTLVQQGLSATGQQLYPQLVNFMENIIDGGNDSPSRQIANVNMETKESEQKTGDIHYTPSTQAKEENVFNTQRSVAEVEEVPHASLPPSDVTIPPDSKISEV